MGNSQLAFLRLCLQQEVIKSNTKKFSWARVLRKAWKYPDRRFYFWWRIASFFYHSKKYLKLAKFLHKRLQAKYGCDIGLGAKIGEGLSISHYVGLVIAYEAVIGINFHARQNTTIGIVSSSQKGCIYIGDNVTIGANCCIIGDNIRIGNNVMVGAMSFINKDIPDNCIVYTPKSNNSIKISIKNNKSIW